MRAGVGSLVERVERYAVRGGEEPPMVAKREDEVDALRVAVSFAWRAMEEWVRNEVMFENWSRRFSVVEGGEGGGGDPYRASARESADDRCVVVGE